MCTALHWQCNCRSASQYFPCQEDKNHRLLALALTICTSVFSPVTVLTNSCHCQPALHLQACNDSESVLRCAKGETERNQARKKRALRRWLQRRCTVQYTSTTGKSNSARYTTCAPNSTIQKNPLLLHFAQPLPLLSPSEMLRN